MALGVPVVTTTAGGNSELVTHGETGLLVAYDDRALLQAEIERLIHDPLFAGALAKRARSFAESFTMDRMISGICTVFKTVSEKV